jgi:hypothetical protein
MESPRLQAIRGEVAAISKKGCENPVYMLDAGWTLRQGGLQVEKFF